LAIANDLLYTVYRDIKSGTSTRRLRRGITTRSMPAKNTMRKAARKRNTRKRADITRSIIMMKGARS